jgi:RNA polymerase sigma-70 factor (ECF subfamily)
MPSSADEAMSRYAEGDAAAFETVYETVAPRLAVFLRRRARQPHRVEDLIQQTFLHMHAARGTFIPGAEVLPWAYVIARRLMIDSSRREWREDCLDLADEPAPSNAEFGGCGTNAETILQAHEAGARLAAAFGRLSEPQRVAFELVKWHGVSQAEAASRLGTTVTGIKLRIHRAYLALRAALADGVGDGALSPAVSMPSIGTGARQGQASVAAGARR